MPQETIALSSQAFSLVSRNALPKYKFVRSFTLNDRTPLPLTNTKSGNLFTDRFNPNLKWYLPKFDFTPDTDQFFSFVASQTGTDKDGRPYNIGTLSLGLQKSMPDDVLNFKSGNPNFQYQEIALTNIAVTLSTTFVDPVSGKNDHYNYLGRISEGASGSLQLVIENIISSGVIILYTNLNTQGASISISFSYDVWTQTGFKKVLIMRPEVIAALHTQTEIIRPSQLASRQIVREPIIARRLNHPSPPPSPPAPPTPSSTEVNQDTFERSTLNSSVQLSMDGKYNKNIYALKYTITKNGAAVRPIINENDLVDFNNKQSEFKELKVLGDIHQKYTSLSRLYIGSLSRTIIVIPSAYSMVRSSHGLSAICQALLDSATGSDSKCKFNFSFTLAPDVSAVEFLELSQDISKITELKDYSVTLPNFLKEGSAPKLTSSFQSLAWGSNTPDQHLFGLGIEIKDQSTDSPAVAAANILIGQLSQERNPFLLATLSLKLDDNFADPVEANAILNFHKSTSSDELSYQIDENLKIITFQNNSPFDLLVSRYAVCTNEGINIISANLAIKSSESVTASFDFPAGDKSIIVDSEIDTPGSISKELLDKFIAFQVVDVAQTKFTFGINAASMEFDSPGISQIDVQITVRELPNISIPQFSLVKLRLVNSTSALIPVQNAISSLTGDILLTVHHIDPSKEDIKVSLQHQFIDQPILILQNTDIVK